MEKFCILISNWQKLCAQTDNILANQKTKDQKNVEKKYKKHENRDDFIHYLFL